MKKPNIEAPPRYCALDGCTTTIGPNCKSGYCSKHFYHSKKKISNGAASAPRASTATPPRKSNSTPADGAGAATLMVTEKHLDAFWSRLSLEEKTNLFQRQLDGV